MPTAMTESSNTLGAGHGRRAAPAQPLAGIRVVVTRALHQAEGLARAFEGAGARVELLPLLEVVPPDDSRPLERAAAELPLYDWLVFTSANAVEAFLPFTGGGLPRRLRVAAVGPSTAVALAGWNVRADVVADDPRAEGIVAMLAPRVARRERLLIPQAADAPDALAAGLVAAGAEPVVVAAYAKRIPRGAERRARQIFAAEPLGWVTFTSPSTVRHFLSVLGEEWKTRRGELRAASIGPVTSHELRRHGIEPAAEAARPGERELVAAVIAAASHPSEG